MSNQCQAQYFWFKNIALGTYILQKIRAVNHNFSNSRMIKKINGVYFYSGCTSLQTNELFSTYRIISIKWLIQIIAFCLHDDLKNWTYLVSFPKKWNLKGTWTRFELKLSNFIFPFLIVNIDLRIFNALSKLGSQILSYNQDT